MLLKADNIREKQARIIPELELDLFMKAASMEGVQSSLNTSYTLKILGLDICQDTIVGDEMQRFRYNEGDLNMGKNSCIDRRVSKYWQSMIGHCLRAFGGLEAIATVKAITTDWLHPNINQYNAREGQGQGRNSS